MNARACGRSRTTTVTVDELQRFVDDGLIEIVTDPSGVERVHMTPAGYQALEHDRQADR